VAAWLPGCSSLSGEEQTARQFLDLYLVSADQQAAITLCSGRARSQLQEEIDLLSGLEGRDQSVAELKPEAEFEKVYEQSRPGGDIAFLFKVVLTRPGLAVPPRDIFLLVGHDAGKPTIKSFSFNSSDSRTSDTP
jgi:hypothetical protein